ncbi:MAG: primosomal protein N' [Candidatus Aminicenantes bacterium]|nr:primosomal protein N' [Candidatus Aminicenantes bacterium]
MSLYADIAVALPLSGTFYYKIPQGLEKGAGKGKRVLVPFHNRLITGFIVGLQQAPPVVSFPLKPIREILDEEPIFSENFLDLTRKLSNYFYSSWGELLQASLPPSFMLRTRNRVHVTETAFKKRNGLSAEEKKILLFIKKKPYTTRYIQRKWSSLNVPALLARLERKGLVRFEREIGKQKMRRIKDRVERRAQMELHFTPDKAALDILNAPVKALEQRMFSPFYFFGTFEQRLYLYLYLIRETLEQGRKILVLVPEIRLTENLIQVFERKLERRFTILHSRMSNGDRETAWGRIKEGKIDVVVGARSAVLSPILGLGLLIVDEEQDESYVQTENPAYDAVTTALFRARHSRALFICGSDIPSISRYFHTQKSGGLLRLGQPPHPKTMVVEYTRKRGLMAPSLLVKIGQNLDKGNRILVFTNRRGYASFISCAACDFVARCRRCDAALTYHKEEQKLVCHYCHSSSPDLSRCPECGSRIVRRSGFGVETVVEELKSHFPAARIVRFDSDTAGIRPARDRILQRFERGDIHILVGTPLILREPRLPHVGFLAALFPESILKRPDFQAGEKTFAVISRLLSRLGEKGEAVIQTSSPDHYSIRFAADSNYEGFVKEELRIRHLMNDPPYTCIVEVIFQGENRRATARSSRDFLRKVREKAGSSIEVYGPAVAPVGKIRGKSRVQVLVKAAKKEVLDEVLSPVLSALRVQKSIRIYR